MRKLSRGEFKLAVILILVVVVVFLVLMAMLDISLFFLALIALVVGLYFLRTRKPELFEIFEKEKKPAQPEDPFPRDPRAPRTSMHLFTPKLILVYYSGASTQQIPVTKAEFSIGRSSSCDFTLTGNTNISKKHCVIQYDEKMGQSVLVDKQSTNGTKLNGQPLTPGQPYPLHAGDMIQLDDRVLTVQLKNY